MVVVLDAVEDSNARFGCFDGLFQSLDCLAHSLVMVALL